MKLGATVLLAALTGCAAPPPVDRTSLAPEAVAARHLDFVVTGAERAALRSRLGPPSRLFEGGRIAVYRMLLIDPGEDPLEAHANLSWYRDNRFPAASRPYLLPSDAAQDWHGRRVDRLVAGGELRVVGHPPDGEDAVRAVVREAEYHLTLIFAEGRLVRHRLTRRAP